jgi:dolichol kinase
MQSTEKYEWNPARKLWHLFGCVAMILIFYLWKDLHGSFINQITLLLFVWTETTILVTIDIIRFYSPAQNDIIRRLPFYGKLMRPIEENHFNATTYYLLAAAILATAHYIGWCKEATLVLAIAVLGVSDPAAAWARYQLNKRAIGNEIAFGLIAFILSSLIVMWTITWWLQDDLSLKWILCIGIIVALVENYTKYCVALISPITSRLKKHIATPATLWLFSLYPDDNLLIPLATALLAGLLPLLQV